MTVKSSYYLIGVLRNIRQDNIFVVKIKEDDRYANNVLFVYTNWFFHTWAIQQWLKIAKNIHQTTEQLLLKWKLQNRKKNLK